MPTYTLNNTATDIDSALQKVVGATTTPLDQNPNMVTSGGVKAYVDTQIGSLNSSVSATLTELENKQTAVSLGRSSQYSTTSENFQIVPLTVQGQTNFLTDNGNNTFTLLQGSYLLWFSFQFKTYVTNHEFEMEVRLQASSGMSDFSGIGTFRGTNGAYTPEQLLNGNYRYVNQDTTFSLQIRDEPEINTYPVYIKNVEFTILKV